MGLKGDGDRCVLQRGAKTVAMFCPGTVRRNAVFFGFSSNNTLVMRATLVAVVVVRLGAICCECGLKCLNGHGTELRPAHSEIKGPSLQIFNHYDESCDLAEQSCCVGPRREGQDGGRSSARATATAKAGTCLNSGAPQGRTERACCRPGQFHLGFTLVPTWHSKGLNYAGRFKKTQGPVVALR